MSIWWFSRSSGQSNHFQRYSRPCLNLSKIKAFQGKDPANDIRLFYTIHEWKILIFYLVLLKLIKANILNLDEIHQDFFKLCAIDGNIWSWVYLQPCRKTWPFPWGSGPLACIDGLGRNNLQQPSRRSTIWNVNRNLTVQGDNNPH